MSENTLLDRIPFNDPATFGDWMNHLYPHWYSWIINDPTGFALDHYKELITMKENNPERIVILGITDRILSTISAISMEMTGSFSGDVFKDPIMDKLITDRPLNGDETLFLEMVNQGYECLKYTFWKKCITTFVMVADLTSVVVGMAVIISDDIADQEHYPRKDIAIERWKKNRAATSAGLKMKTMNQPHSLGTVKEISEKLGVSLKQIRNWKKEGILDQKFDEFYNPSTPS